eukprot:scaffold327294_cov42-Prasinocladus_malaysianus.AAC.1
MAVTVQCGNSSAHQRSTDKGVTAIFIFFVRLEFTWATATQHHQYLGACNQGLDQMDSQFLQLIAAATQGIGRHGTHTTQAGSMI